MLTPTKFLLSRNETTPKPTLVCIYGNTLQNEANKGCLQCGCASLYTSKWAFFVALSFDRMFGNCQIPTVKHKASSERLLYIGSSLSSCCETGLRWKNCCKVSEKDWDLQIFRGEKWNEVAERLFCSVVSLYYITRLSQAPSRSVLWSLHLTVLRFYGDKSWPLGIITVWPNDLKTA